MHSLRRWIALAFIIIPFAALAQTIGPGGGGTVGPGGGGNGCTSNCTLTGTTTTSALKAGQTFNGWVPTFGVLTGGANPVVSGGTAYAALDTITLAAGCTDNPVVVVSAVTGGVITAINVVDYGTCLTVPAANPLSQLSTSGSGAGATFNFSFAPQASNVPATFGPAASNNGGTFVLATNIVGGGPLQFAGNESMFIAPYTGDIRSGGFDTVIGPGNCGAVSGAPLFNFGSMTCIGSNAGRNLANGSSNTIVIGNYGTGLSPNWIGNTTVVISPGQVQNLTNSLQNTLVNTGGGNLATGAGVVAIGPGSGSCAAATRSVLIGGASSAGSNGGAKGCNQMIVLGGNTGNVGITGHHAIIMGDGVGLTNCTNNVSYILIGNGNESTPVDCIAGVNSQMNISNTIIQSTAPPTISSGFGTSPTVPAGFSTAAFQINVGTGGTASTGVVKMGNGNMPHGWACDATNITNSATSVVACVAGVNLLTLTNYSRTTGAVTAWAASDIITVQASGF